MPSDPGGQMLVVAPKNFLPYPVTKEWCDRVRDALAAKPRGEQAKLAKYLGCSTGMLSDTLSGKFQTSELVEPIHRYFGWTPPLPPTASLDAGELLHGYARMTKQQREFLDLAARQLEGSNGEQARKALQEMLKAFRAQTDD